MKKALTIFLITYYSIGAFFLPMGDFSLLPGTPEMYRHCKMTEHKDMTVIDFITDHLLNIDGLFDKHENGDEQKPHQPAQSHHLVQPTFSNVISYTLSSVIFHVVKVKITTPSENFQPSGYISKIFHPPIAT